MIKLQVVDKTFQDGDVTIDAVKDVSFELNPGRFVSIIGPSGSGKSTLLTMIGALQTPTRGTIEINKRDISSLSDSELSKLRFDEIGFVLQGSNLVPYLTIKEQMVMKLKQSKKASEMNRDEIVKTLQIEHILDKYPDEISGGERQRAAIALALLLNPSILLADEPTASLDTDRAYNVVNLLKEVSVNYNTTVIMVTHDARMLDLCDDVFEMVDGNLSKVK